MADEIMTFDEILADPTYKAEFDRRITKALSTVQSKLDAEVEKNKKYEEKGTGETVETLKKQLSELQEKYDKDTGDYKAQISDRDYADAMKKAVADKGIKFSSKAAEKAYFADLKEKHLELKDGVLDGFDEWHKAQTEADPSAFQARKPTPSFAKPVGTGGAPASEGKGAMFAKQFNAQYAQTTTKE